MTPFTPIDYNEATERRLAIRLWTMWLACVESRPGTKQAAVEDAAFRAACGITCDFLGYGMAPTGVNLMVREAYAAHVSKHGLMPSPLDSGARTFWRDILTDAVVAGLRGLR